MKKKMNNVVFPLNYEKTTNHYGVEVIKPFHPAIKGWQKLIEPVFIRDDQAPGVPCGYVNDLTVLDFDNVELYGSMIKTYPEILDTRINQTPNGGYHVFFKYDDSIPTCSIRSGLLNGLDIRNDGGFIIAPPAYQIINDVKIPYYKINENSVKKLPPNLTQYILENCNCKKINKTNLNEQEYSESRFHFHNLELLKEALQKIPNGDKWRQVTNAIKGLVNSENYEQIIEIWDQWSKGHQTYNYDKNLEIFAKMKPKIHPNYIFKRAEVKTRVFSIPYIEPELNFTHRFNTQYISNGMKKLESEIAKMDYAIKSGTGTGKTYYASDLVKTKHMKDRVFLVTNRVSLSQQHKKSFEKCGFKHYQDRSLARNDAITEFVQNTNNAKLIIQINSLFKIREIPKDHILILDEVTSLLKYLTSGNIAKMEVVILKFNELIRNAKQVICIDGDLDQYSIDYIQAFRSKPMQLIKNDYQNAKGIKCTFTRNLDRVSEKIENSIKDGYLTAHACDTKAMTKIVNEKLIELGISENQIKSYHTDSKEDRNDLADVNRTWNGKHVTYSPSIVTGVDYTADYRTVFLYVSACGMTHGKTTINARDMAQQIARFRNINELVIYLDTSSYKPPFESFEQFKEQFLESIQESNNHLSPLVVDIDEGSGKLALKDNHYVELSLRYKFEDSMIQSDQENYLVDRIKEKGFDVFFLMDPKQQEKIVCKHTDIDDYIEILTYPDKHQEPNTTLFENVKKRAEIFAIKDIDFLTIDKTTKTMLACPGSTRRCLNFGLLTKDNFHYEHINVNTYGHERHLISIIRSIMNMENLTIHSFEDPMIQFSDIKYDETDIKIFRKLFNIKNKVDYLDQKNKPKFIKKFAKVINELTLFCQYFEDRKLFNIDKKQKQIRSGDLRGKVYYKIEINQNYVDMNLQLLGRKKIPLDDCLLDDDDEFVPDE